MTDPLVAHLDHACIRCSLHQTARHVCLPGKGRVTDIRMVIIGEAPGKEEDQGGEIFVGPAARLLDQYLSKAGVDVSQIRFENLVHCFPHKDGLTRQPTKTESSVCSPYLWQTLAAILTAQPENPPLLIALGNTALEALAGVKNITKNCGSVRPMVAPLGFPELAQYKVVGVIHPSSVLRGQESNAPRIVSDLTYAWKEATGKAPRYWKDYTWVTDHRDFVSWVDEQIALHREGKIEAVGYDLETTGLDDILYFKEAPTGVLSEVVTFNLCTQPGRSVVVPYYHQNAPWLGDKMIMKVLRDALASLLTVVPTWMWGGKFDLLWGWVKLMVDVSKYDFDGLDAHRWLWGSRKPHRLDDVMAADLGFNGHGVGLDKGRLFWASPEELTRYAGGDADGTLQSCGTLISQMKEYKVYEAFLHVLMRGIRPVAGMEAAGVKVNLGMNRYLTDSYPNAMEPLMQSVESSPWGEKTREFLAARTIPDKKKPGMMKPAPLAFGLGSTTTLQRLIFTDMGMPVIHSGDSGPSADREAMDKLDEHCHDQETKWSSSVVTLERALTLGTHESDRPQIEETLGRVRVELEGWRRRREILKQITEWRAMKDEWTRYVKSIPERVDPRGFVHPDYNMGGTVTGRFSSWFHGFPRKSHGSNSSKPKWQFVSRWMGSGGAVMVADRSQSEMRVLASLSGDEALCAVINSGIDLHTANAANMFGVSIASVTDDQREIAKRCFVAGTEIITREGHKKIGDCVGTTQVLLTTNGQWVEAPIRSFGKQRVMRLVIRRQGVTKTIDTTPDHIWFADYRDRSRRGKELGRERWWEVKTSDLIPGSRLRYAFARSPKNSPNVVMSPFGIAHGVVFGDGTAGEKSTTRTTSGWIDLYGHKDAALARYFSMCPQTSRYEHGQDVIRVACLPRFFKNPPPLTEAKSYLYGWLAGYFAADGRVNAKGKTISIASSVRANIELVRDVCAIIGIGTYHLTEGQQTIRKKDGEDKHFPSFRINMMSAHLSADFFLIAEHRRRFEEGCQETRLRYWNVVSVGDLGSEEEVFCAEVGNTNSFALADNILTHNCGFGVVYMVGAGTLSQKLNIPKSEAQRHIDRWNATYPKTLTWMQEQYAFAKRYKCVRTPFGRIRWIDGIDESRWGDDACRQACNAPIQSVSSDITYMALLEVIAEIGLEVELPWEEGTRRYTVVEGRLKCKSKTFGFIHDSIMVDAAPGEWWVVATILRDKLERWTNEAHPWLLVPMTSDTKIGASWGLSCALTIPGPDNCMVVSGDLLNVDRLQAEMLAYGGCHVLSEDVTIKVKDGQERKTKRLEFSMDSTSDGSGLVLF